MSSAARHFAGGSARPQPDNLAPLTGIRFVAALTIVLGHSVPALGVVTMAGMPLFFTLSGFIIHYVYSDLFAAAWRPAAASFAGARFSRLYPLYFVLWLAALITTPMAASLFQYHNLPKLLAYVFAVYTWFPIFIDGHAAGDWYYGISWSVSTEIFFYVAYVAVLYRLANISTSKVCLLTLIVLSIAAYAFFYLLFLTRDIWESWGLAYFPQFPSRTQNFANSFYRWFLYISPYCHLFEFVAGCLTCQLFLLTRRLSNVRLGWECEALSWVGCLAIAALVWICGLVGATHPWLGEGDRGFVSFFVTLHMNFMLAPFCCLTMFAVARRRSILARALSSGIALLLGEISYSTYLGHPLAQTFFGLSVLRQWPAPVVSELAVVYLFSWMFYAAIEIPAKTRLRRLLAKLSPSGGAEPFRERIVQSSELSS